MRRTTIAVVVAVLLGLAAPVLAQSRPAAVPPPAAPPPAAPPPAAPPPAAPSPAGRPRAVAVMTLDSPAWPDGGVIPLRHSQAGRDVSPALAWQGAPDGVVSYVLVVRDLDQLSPATGEDTLHWLVWNIPATTTALPQGMPQGNAPLVPGPAGGGGGSGAARVPTDGPRQTSVTGPNYRGPAAPASGPPHHYAFEIYALDTWIDVSAFGQFPAAMRSAVTAAMAGHIRGKGVRIGTFRRPAL